MALVKAIAEFNVPFINLLKLLSIYYSLFGFILPVDFLKESLLKKYVLYTSQRMEQLFILGHCQSFL